MAYFNPTTTKSSPYATAANGYYDATFDKNAAANGTGTAPPGSPGGSVGGFGSGFTGIGGNVGGIGTGGADQTYGNTWNQLQNQVKGAAGLTNINGAVGVARDSALAQNAPLADPGYLEDLYKQHGQDLINDPSASEKLFAEGAAGSNPFYDYAQQQTIKAIDDSSAARGNYNSSYTLHNIGNAVADLRGQQAHELGQLAGQSDTARANRYNDSFNYADRAQGRMEGRARSSIEDQGTIDRGRAGLVNGFYGEAGKESTAAYMAKIEAMLKESGMPLEEQKQILDSILATAGVVTKAVKP